MLQRFHTNRSRASRSLFGDVILEVLEIDAIAETELKKKQGNRRGERITAAAARDWTHMRHLGRNRPQCGESPGNREFFVSIRTFWRGGELRNRQMPPSYL